MHMHRVQVASGTELHSKKTGSIRVKALEAAQRHFLQRDAPAVAPRGARIVVVAGAFFVY
jgi:hypothetical protein